jgi:hypothetical protein
MMTGVDPFDGMAFTEAHKAAIRKQLALLANQDKHPGLRDMAKDVLTGKTDLRGAMLGPNQTAVLVGEAMGQFSQWCRNLTPDERAEQERLAQDYAEEARREAAAEALPVRRPRPAADDEEWKTQRPILRKRRR